MRPRGVRVALPSWMRWKPSTETAAHGKWVRRALRNAADGSMATTSTCSSQAAGRAASQAPTPALPRPSTTPSPGL